MFVRFVVRRFISVFYFSEYINIHGRATKCWDLQSSRRKLAEIFCGAFDMRAQACKRTQQEKSRIPLFEHAPEF